MSEESTGGVEPLERPPGTVIRVEHAGGHTWHHSVEYDGVEGIHETACGQEIHTSSITSVGMELVVWGDLDPQVCCGECAGSVESLCPEVSES